MTSLAADDGWRRALRRSGALAGRGLEAVGKFLLYALAARELGAVDAGRFFLCLGAILMIATLARLGLERPLTRHVAAERAVGAYRLARQAMLRGGLVVFAVSVAAGVVLWSLSPIIARLGFHQPELQAPLRAAALVLPAQNMAYVAAYVLIGLDRAGAAQMVMNAVAPCFLVVALLAVRLTAVDLLHLYACAYAGCALLGGAIIMREAWTGDAPIGASHEPLGSLWGAGRTLLPVELSQAALLSLPTMLVGVFAGAVEVSAFSIASRVSMLVATIVISIGAMAAPGFARHHRRRAFAELRMDNQRARRAAYALCLPAVIGMTVFAWPVLGAMHAPLPGAPLCLWILLVGQLAFCLLPCQDTLLAMTGHATVLRRLALVQVAACTIGCLLLVPPLGGVGAAIASSAIWTFGAIGCALAARKLVWAEANGALAA